MPLSNTVGVVAWGVDHLHPVPFAENAFDLVITPGQRREPV
jgi:hypothetical protein